MQRNTTSAKTQPKTTLVQMEVPKRLEIPLVAAIVCGTCGCPQFSVGAIEPGFVVGCAICQTTHERGVIVRCANCGLQACGEGMYQLYLTIRDRALQRPD